jgi:hypothetical protein
VPNSPNPGPRRTHRARRATRLVALFGGLLTLVAVALSGGQAMTDAVLACGDHTAGLTTSTIVCPTPVPPTNTPNVGITPVIAPTATPSPVPPTVEPTVTLVITPAMTRTPVAATATPTAEPCVCPTATATTAPPPPPPTIAPPTATPTEQPCVCPTATPVPPTATTAPPPPPPTVAPPTATPTEQPCVCPTATPVPPTATATVVAPPPPPPPTITPPTPTTVPVSGCTPGYWRQAHHFDSWQGYSPTTDLEAVFDVPNSLGLDTTDLSVALTFGGGSGVDGASRILLRAGVAALLNASSDGVNYSLTTADVISRVNAALATGDRTTIINLANDLDQRNNTGVCTLS